MVDCTALHPCIAAQHATSMQSIYNTDIFHECGMLRGKWSWFMIVMAYNGQGPRVMVKWLYSKIMLDSSNKAMHNVNTKRHTIYNGL